MSTSRTGCNQSSSLLCTSLPPAGGMVLYNESWSGSVRFGSCDLTFYVEELSVAILVCQIYEHMACLPHASANVAHARERTSYIFMLIIAYMIYACGRTMHCLWNAYLVPSSASVVHPIRLGPNACLSGAHRGYRIQQWKASGIDTPDEIARVLSSTS